MLRNVRHPRNHLAPNYETSHDVRDKLMMEISELRAKLDRVSGSLAPENLEKVQTFKEMIYSRNALLQDLSRQKDERASYAELPPISSRTIQ